MQLRPGLTSIASLALLLVACGDDGGATTSGASTTNPGSTGIETTPTGTGTDATPTTGDPTAAGTTTAASQTSSTSELSATDATTTTTEPGTGTTTQASGETTVGTTLDTTGPGETTGGASSTGTTGVPCEDGTVICENDVAKTCDGMGGFKNEQVCDSVCVDGVGCKLCLPGAAECEGANVLVCNEAGDGKDVVETCDAVQGVTCNPDQGACEGACSQGSLGLSYIGCDYYPTVLQQHDSYNAGANQYAVAVSNTSDSAAARRSRRPSLTGIAPTDSRRLNQRAEKGGDTSRYTGGSSARISRRAATSARRGESAVAGRC